MRPGNIVHHIVHLNEDNISDPEISLSFDNFKLECKRCHDREEDHFIKDKRTKCSFDENGQPIPPTSKNDTDCGRPHPPPFF